MPKTQLERIKVKSRDSQFENILIDQFELSPREAEAIVQTANDVYELKHYDPSQHVAKDKIVRTVISKDAKHGPKLETVQPLNIVENL